MEEFYLDNIAMTKAINAFSENGKSLVFDKSLFNMEQKVVGTDCMAKLVADSKLAVQLTDDYRDFVCRGLVPSLINIQKGFNDNAETVSKSLANNDPNRKAEPSAYAGAVAATNEMMEDANRINEYVERYEISLTEAVEMYNIVKTLSLEDKYTEEELDCLIRYYPDLLRKLNNANQAASYTTAEVNRVYSEINTLLDAVNQINNVFVKQCALEHHLNSQQMKCVNNISNVENHEGYVYDEKIQDMQIVAIVLFGEGYTTAFVAGMLGNMYIEGEVGRLEAVNQGTNNPEDFAYWNHMNSIPFKNPETGKECTYYEYFSSVNPPKHLYEVDFPTYYNLVTQVMSKYPNASNVIGCGCVQWTQRSRYEGLLQCYIDADAAGNNDGQLSYEECVVAESNHMANEFAGDYKYVVNDCGKYNSEASAINSAEIICNEYERPNEEFKKLEERKQAAADLYNAMIG